MCRIILNSSWRQVDLIIIDPRELFSDYNNNYSKEANIAFLLSNFRWFSLPLWSLLAQLVLLQNIFRLMLTQSCALDIPFATMPYCMELKRLKFFRPTTKHSYLATATTATTNWLTWPMSKFWKYIYFHFQLIVETVYCHDFLIFERNVWLHKYELVLNGVYIHCRYYTAPRYVVPPTVRTVSPYYRYASVAPVVASNVAPVAPNTVHTINGSPVAPIPPFATLPGLASRVYVGNY